MLFWGQLDPALAYHELSYVSFTYDTIPRMGSGNYGPQMSETETALLPAFGVDDGEATEQWFSTMGDFAPKRICGNI